MSCDSQLWQIIKYAHVSGHQVLSCEKSFRRFWYQVASICDKSSHCGTFERSLSQVISWWDIWLAHMACQVMVAHLSGAYGKSSHYGTFEWCIWQVKWWLHIWVAHVASQVMVPHLRGTYVKSSHVGTFVMRIWQVKSWWHIWKAPMPSHRVGAFDKSCGRRLW